MISNAKLRARKAHLTRAINSGDPLKVIASVRESRLIFEADGFPDCWPMFRNALWDIDTHELRARDDGFDVLRMAHTEEDSWH